jgi:predicted nucleic acid-binding protein
MTFAPSMVISDDVARRHRAASNAQAVLNAVKSSERHEFWPDSVSSDMPLDGVLGHRQVTDSYLAHLARSQGGRLVTFDHGLAKSYTDVVDLVPVIPVQPTG